MKEDCSIRESWPFFEGHHRIGYKKYTASRGKNGTPLRKNIKKMETEILFQGLSRRCMGLIKFFGVRMKQLTAYLCLFFWISFSVYAHEEGAPHAHKDSCKQDVEKFCKTVPKGETINCLKDKEDSLGEECKALIGEIRELAKQRLEACKEDRDKFCSDKGKNVIRCLSENSDYLSKRCKDLLPKKSDPSKSKAL